MSIYVSILPYIYRQMQLYICICSVIGKLELCAQSLSNHRLNLEQ